MSTQCFISTTLGPTDSPRCPKCLNSLQNALLENNLVRCASCKLVFIYQEKRIVREITVVFNVVGYACQTLRINDECKLTDKEIIDGLNSGSIPTILTTLQEGGELVTIDEDGDMVDIGTVQGCDTNCEYDDFEIRS